MTGLLSLKGRPRRAAVLWVAAAVLLVAAGVWGALALAERAAPIPAAPAAGAAAGTAEGYTVSCYWNGAFYAGGSDGRLDRITPEGVREAVALPDAVSLTSVYADGSGILFGSQEGAVISSRNGMEFDVAQAGGKTAVLGITALHGRYLAVTGNGTVLTSSDREQWQAETTPVRHDLISVASTGQMAMAVSAESDILLTRDGENWDTYNFNEMYEGLYPEYVFTSVTALGNSFFILGHTAEAPDTPLIMFSEDGSVWMHKELAAINNEAPELFYPIQPRMITSDIDQLLILCGGGQLLTVPSCVTCNQMLALSEQELYTMALGGGKILLAGEAYSYQILNDQDVRQERIQAEQAAQDLQSGAVLIDVREDEELEADGYIEGSLHIPLDQLEAQLPQRVPDQSTELIFYCAMGSRAQQALELAQQMGYERVYNLGGLRDWPYGIVD